MTVSLLVAGPDLTGSFFERAVLLMLEDSGGALGLIVSRPAGVSIGELLPQAGAYARQLPAYIGGPVERSGGWCLYPQAQQHHSELQLCAGLHLSRDREVLTQLLAGQQAFYLLLGYTGWADGQLEQEVKRGNWLWGEVESSELAALLWRTPDEERWEAALALLGADAGSVVSGSAQA